MSGIIKNVMRLSLLKTTCSFKPPVASNSKHLIRSFWSLSSYRPSFHHSQNNVFSNGCGCSVARLHSKYGLLLSKSSEMADRSSSQSFNTEKELTMFLNEEITAEKKQQKIKTIPDNVSGFSVKLEGSEVILTKKTDSETIEVCFNINHTVDADPESDVDPGANKQEAADMKSKPNFEVELRRGNKTLGFSCSMLAPLAQTEMQDDVYNDLFSIDEVVFYEGDWKETNYSVSGEVLDGTLYDMFMDMLEDKGVNNEFIEKVIDFSTAYEHTCYIKMLEDIQKFCSSK